MTVQVRKGAKKKITESKRGLVVFKDKKGGGDGGDKVSRLSKISRISKMFLYLK